MKKPKGGMMKQIVMIGLLGISVVFAAPMKMFDIKSGKIEYSIKGGGNVMGMVQTSTIGKKRLIFDDYGRKSLTEEVKIDTETTGGRTTKKKTHTLTYMNGAILYTVDFDRKRITRTQNPALTMGVMMGSGSDMRKTGEAMMKKMGGRKTGTATVAGVTCDVWDLMGVKQCIYKGITLKVESNMMGMQNIETATQAEFNIPLGKDAFKLPDFPVYKMDMMNPMAQPVALDKSSLDEMDAKESAKIAKEGEAAGNMVKAGLSAGIAAAAKLGYDPKSKKDMTPEQKAAFERAMQEAVMVQMGGEEGMFKKQKQQILDDLAKIPQARACFKKAKSVKDANSCEELLDSEYPEYHTRWDETKKQQLLQEIDRFEKAAPCIRQANSFDALEKCMPE